VTEETFTPEQILESEQDPMTIVKLGATLLAAAYERLTKRTELKGENALAIGASAAPKDLVPGNALSYYGLCLARSLGNYQEGAKFIHIAIHNEPMVGEHYLILARLWKHARNRRKLVDAIEKGLEASPRYLPLRRLAREVGLRRTPVVAFLSRDNALNQALGRLRANMEKKKLDRELAAEEAAAEARNRARRPSPAGRPAPAPRPPASRRPSKG